MDINQFELMVNESSKDVEFLAGLKQKLDKEEFDSLIFNTFSRFIDNSEIISKIISIGSHTWEISVILEMDKEPWFSETLLFLTQEFRAAMYSNKEQCITTIEKLYPSIHESLACWHDAFFLQNDSDIKNPRHEVRAYFRMLGDMIESTHYPHIRFIYQILRLNKNNPMGDKPKEVSVGKIITFLSEIHQLDQIYRATLFNISLSQWRNIAQHSNYRLNKDKKIITCTYGSNIRKEVQLTINELTNLLFTLNKLQALQKIAVDFFLVEFMDELQLDKYGDIGVTVETIVSQIGNGLGLDGFKVLSVIDKQEECVFKIEDISNRGLVAFKNTVCRLTSFMAMLKDTGHIPVFELYNSSGIKLTEARVQKIGQEG